MSRAEDDEWVTVIRSKTGRSRPKNLRGRRSSKPTTTHASFYGESASAQSGDGDGAACAKGASLQIVQCADRLSRSDFMSNLLSAVRGVHADQERDKSIKEIVCYGVGNFSEPRSPSMLQLACALLLRREIGNGIEGSADGETDDGLSLGIRRGKSSVRMLYFEPDMLPVERKILQAFDVEIIETNEEGKRRIVGTSHSTLFFMPHCPMRLYSNVLWANWDPSLLFDGNVVVFGNDFHEYDQRTIVTEDRSDPSNCIFQILPFAKSTKLGLCGQKKSRSARPVFDDVLLNLERAFSDTSITWFHRGAELFPSGAFPDQPEEYFKKGDNCELL